MNELYKKIDNAITLGKKHPKKLLLQEYTKELQHWSNKLAIAKEKKDVVKIDLIENRTDQIFKYINKLNEKSKKLQLKKWEYYLNGKKTKIKRMMTLEEAKKLNREYMEYNIQGRYVQA